MKFAFIIFKYFPYGGAQRDMMRIAQACVDLGHTVDIYTMAWAGPSPQSGISVQLVSGRGLMNHHRYRSFIERVHARLPAGQYDLVVGFNRMAGLDVYFAADPCFAEATSSRGFLHRLSGRHRWFASCESAVFGQEAQCAILLLSEAEQATFQRWYQTPATRFHLLPPFLSPQRMQQGDRTELRSRLRNEFGFGEGDRVLLLIGSGFRTKGLDRAITGLASLPEALRRSVRLLAIGQDNPRPFIRLASALGLQEQVRVMGGRSDIPQLMQGADLLVHPARRELAGHVLLEAMACGLPVLTTDVCGYSPHIQAAGAGMVLMSPFHQAAFDAALLGMLESPAAQDWRARGHAYASRVMAENDGYVEARILESLANQRQTES